MTDGHVRDSDVSAGDVEDPVGGLVGAVLAEQHDEWAVGRRYMTQEVTTSNEALPRAELAEAAA